MELDIFILTVEDFLEGTVKEDFLKEEIADLNEELKDYSLDVDKREEIPFELIDLIQNGLDEIMIYFEEEGKDLLFIKRGLEKIKRASLLLMKNSGGEGVEKEIEGKRLFKTKKIFLPSEMLTSQESKVPPKAYYDKPKELEEHVVEYISDPLDSPLYSLLLGYQEFGLKKIDINIWQEKLLDAEEELNYILDRIDDVVYNSDASADELRISIFEAIDLIEKIDYASSEDNFEGKIDFYIGKIKDLNLTIYNLYKQLLPEAELSNQDSILEAYEKFDEEDFKTANYLLIENDLYDFLENLITAEQFLKSINRMRNLIESAREQYENLPVSEDELTLEVFRGDKLMREGVELWAHGLDIIEDALSPGDKEGLQEGLDYIFNGNKKLILVQYFSAHIERQAQIQKGF